jgi:hypothetical protein
VKQSVEEFIAATDGEPWEYGFSDCAPWALRWVCQVKGLPFVRPDYDSALGAARLLKGPGGAMGLFQRYADDLACPVTDRPEVGDVGVVSNPSRSLSLLLAVFVGHGLWAAKAHDGRVIKLEAQPVRAWRVQAAF